MTQEGAALEMCGCRAVGSLRFTCLIVLGIIAATPSNVSGGGKIAAFARRPSNSTLRLQGWGGFGGDGQEVSEIAADATTTEATNRGDRANAELPDVAQVSVDEALKLSVEPTISVQRRIEFLHGVLRAVKNEDPAARSRVWNGLALLFVRDSQLDQARHAAGEAYNYAQDAASPTLVLEAQVSQGRIHRAEGKYAEAISLLAEVVAKAKGLDDPLVFKASNALGIVAKEYGAYDQAVDSFQLAWETAKQLGTAMPEAVMLNNMAFGLMQAGKYQEAQQHYQLAINHPATAEDPRLEFAVVAGIADLILRRGNSKRAIRQMNELLARKLPVDRRQSGVAYTILGRAYLHAGEFDQASEQVQQALELLNSRDVLRVRAKILQIQILKAEQKFDACLAELDDVLDEAARDVPVELSKLLQLKAEVLAAMGRHEEAYTALTAYDETVRQIETEKAMVQMAFLRSKYDVQQQEQQFQILQEREVSARQKAELDRKAAELLAQREKLLRQGTLITSLFVVCVSAVVIYANRRRLKAEYDRDVAEQLREREQDANRRLTQEVEKRTEELKKQLEEREALREALERQRKDEAIGQLTGGLAHDFNNLLTVIIHSNELLKSAGETLTPEQEQLVNESLRAASAGANINRQLLAYARKQSLNPVEVPVAQFVSDNIGLLQRTVGEGIELELSMERRDGVIVVDPSQLTTALINLCSNARDAMKGRGQMRLIVRHEVEKHGPKHHHFVAFVVLDHGCGMSPEQLTSACEPFYTTKDASLGTGLGLSMVKGFAQQSGGELSLTSRLGVGTKACLRFPVSRRELAQPPTALAPHDSALESRRLLIVEDNATVQKAIASSCRAFGFEVTVANSATEAQQQMASQEFDVVLSDLQMPGEMDGRQLAEWLLKRYPNVQVMLMSGYVGSTATPTPVPILPKPFSPQQLLERLSNPGACQKT